MGMIAAFTSEASAGSTWIVIKNIGQGPALDVSFNLKENFKYYDEHFFDIADNDLIKNGIMYFPPDRKYRFFITSLKNNGKQKILDRIIIEVSYKNILNEHSQEVYTLLFSELEKNAVMKSDTYLGLISLELEKINKQIEKLTKSMKDEHFQGESKI